MEFGPDRQDNDERLVARFMQGDESALDEVAPARPLDGADALGHLSPEDGGSLSEDLLDTQG